MPMDCRGPRASACRAIGRLRSRLGLERVRPGGRTGAERRLRGTPGRSRALQPCRRWLGAHVGAAAGWSRASVGRQPRIRDGAGSRGPVRRARRSRRGRRRLGRLSPLGRAPDRRCGASLGFQRRRAVRGTAGKRFGRASAARESRSRAPGRRGGQHDRRGACRWRRGRVGRESLRCMRHPSQHGAIRPDLSGLGILHGRARRRLDRGLGPERMGPGRWPGSTGCEGPSGAHATVRQGECGRVPHARAANGRPGDRMGSELPRRVRRACRSRSMHRDRRLEHDVLRDPCRRAVAAMGHTDRRLRRDLHAGGSWALRARRGELRARARDRGRRHRGGLGPEQHQAGRGRAAAGVDRRGRQAFRSRSVQRGDGRPSALDGLAHGRPGPCMGMEQLFRVRRARRPRRGEGDRRGFLRVGRASRGRHGARVGLLRRVRRGTGALDRQLRVDLGPLGRLLCRRVSRKQRLRRSGRSGVRDTSHQRQPVERDGCVGVVGRRHPRARHGQRSGSWRLRFHRKRLRRAGGAPSRLARARSSMCPCVWPTACRPKSTRSR